MSSIMIKYRLPLKLQLISWFLLSESIGQHITSYQRLLDIKEDEIELNTYELSEFYQQRFIDSAPGEWANDLVSFLKPKLSRFFYELGEINPAVKLKIIHRKIVFNKNIPLNSTL